MNTNADALGFALMEHLGPAALTGGTMSIHDAFVLGWNAAPQAAAINAELLEACAAMVKWDDAENNAPDYLIDGGAQKTHTSTELSLVHP